MEIILQEMVRIKLTSALHFTDLPSMLSRNRWLSYLEVKKKHSVL